MDALYHARSSAQKWGGRPDEYLPFHLWFDKPSSDHCNDKRHRMLRHHSLGIQQLQEIFGAYYTNTAGKTVPLKQLGEQHVIEDLGFIPSFSDWVRSIGRERWMSGRPGRYRVEHKGEAQIVLAADAVAKPHGGAVQAVVVPSRPRRR